MIEKKFDAERLLEIDNAHVAGCGPPPSIDATDKYVGYYESDLGEQVVFIGDRKTGKAVVRGGDIDWTKEYEVSLERPVPSGLLLGHGERQWIAICLEAINPRFDPSKCIEITGIGPDAGLSPPPDPDQTG
jgi:hypothetical protein